MFVLMLLFIIAAALFFCHAVAGDSGLTHSSNYDVSPAGGSSMHQ
jgi:hypothetical protein